MSKILVTGATGVVGKSTVEHLLKKGVPASQVIALSRNKENLEDLAAKGVNVREGDYMEYATLLRAFEGVDRIMLTSAVAFTDRCTQHYNVITAARQMGVKHLVYMSIMRKVGSDRKIPEVTESDRFTEQVLKSSGLDYTIVYHPPFADLLSFYYGPNPYDNGIKVPAKNGQMAPATRDELAEAHAEILSTPGHENRTYSLGGSQALSFSDIATILSDIKGQPVTFKTITADEYSDGMVEQGAARHVANFITGWVLAIEGGEFEYQSGDLERLLGRKTKSFRELMENPIN